MSEQKDDDVLAGDHVGDEDGAWLDLNVPQQVHDQLAAWGGRMGLTADGYAKLLLFTAIHPLLAAEMGDAERLTPQGMAEQAGERSRRLWADQLQKYRAAEDLAPAPVASDEAAGWRAYAADSFDWGSDAPPAHPYATVDRTGALTVSGKPPKPNAPQSAAHAPEPRPT